MRYFYWKISNRYWELRLQTPLPSDPWISPLPHDEFLVKRVVTSVPPCYQYQIGNYSDFYSDCHQKILPALRQE